MGVPLIRVLTGAGATVTAMDISPVVAESEAKTAPGPGRATVVSLDIADKAAVDRAFADAISDTGGLDALVHTAGVLASEPAEEATESSLDFMFEVNVKGTVFSNQAVFETLRRQGSGSIVNFGSVSGLRPEPNSIPYSASKGPFNPGREVWRMRGGNTAFG